MDIEPFKRAIAARFPAIRIRKAVPILTGWASFVLEINGEYIFRFPIRPDVLVQYQKEIALLPVLAARLPLPVPRFEFVARSDRLEGCFVGYRKLPGEPLSKALTLVPDVAHHLGRFLVALHSFPLEKASKLNVPGGSPGDWRRRYVDFWVWIRENVFPLLNPAGRESVVDLWKSFLGNPANFQFQPALIHADLAEEHILCDPQSLALTGVIDWGDAMLGDPALDFVGLYLLGGRKFVRRVREAYSLEVGENFWGRLSFYTAIVPFYEIQYGLLIRNEKYIQAGLEHLHLIPKSIEKEYD